jgi:hypothetical protein
LEVRAKVSLVSVDIMAAVLALVVKHSIRKPSNLWNHALSFCIFLSQITGFH